MMSQKGGEGRSFERERSIVSSSSSAKEGENKNKRAREDEEEAEFLELTPQELAPLSRMEKKRYRERKRRFDLNKGFDGILDLLVEIDPVTRAEMNAEKLRRANSKGSHDDNLISRVELFDRTIHVLQTLHRENEARKVIIKKLILKDGETSIQVPPTSLGGGGTLAVENPSLQAEVYYSRLVAQQLQLQQQPQQLSVASLLSLAPMLSAIGSSSAPSNHAASIFANASTDTLAGLLSGTEGAVRIKNPTLEGLLSQQVFATPASSLQANIDRENLVNLEIVKLLRQQREQQALFAARGGFLGE